MEQTIENKKNKCCLCGYEWESIVNIPKQCPRCKRYDYKEESDIQHTTLNIQETSAENNQGVEAPLFLASTTSTPSCSNKVKNDNKTQKD